MASPRSWRTSRSRKAGGRGRLPTWVVRIRSSLRFMGPPYGTPSTSHGRGQGQEHAEGADASEERRGAERNRGGDAPGGGHEQHRGRERSGAEAGPRAALRPDDGGRDRRATRRVDQGHGLEQEQERQAE